MALARDANPEDHAVTDSDGKLDPKALEAAMAVFSRARVMPDWSGPVSEAITAYLAAALPPAGAGEVVVKALRWEQPDGDGENNSWVGHGTDWCQFYARKVGDEWMLEGPTDNAEDAAAFDTPAEAKAVGQAEYAQRILSAIELSGNSGELPVPTNTVGGEVAAETIKRYAWQRLTGSTSLLPVVRDDGDWVKFSDVVDICAANQRLRRSPDTTSEPDLREQADELWMKLMPAMQTSAWEDGSRDVYADKVAALAMIEAALFTRSAP
jgi:hypothetical protein